ncbi:tol-pal system protein YbgF [Candidatus Accumulibacter phosphatis]|jgi:tol-pal system protein YbgF|uniref:Cell division coordinator CpoB n=1 Tax=Candidatus Accumulibacter phosphatis TaxID=327160 RepID=A0ABX1TY53_9PROT|nr:tol-pal system protein YbgF [Candidatus Accumulibacter phosphatis]
MPGPCSGRLPTRTRVISIALLLAALGAQQAHAGLFDDDEARRQVSDLQLKSNERLDTVAKGQMELANQIQELRDENARLRGQVETLNYELDAATKRQKDFYIDLDTRLRKLETPSASAASATAAGATVKPADDSNPASEAPRKSASDPATETREYEAALNLFRANKLKEAAAAFETFARTHPDSTLTPNAYYWLGNAHYAMRDCRRALEAQRLVGSKWPAHAKAPDALLNVATCQQELGDSKSAKNTLDALLAKYPDSSAAKAARQRLKK